ncbi:MAG: phosphotransferase [Micrococcus sp.]|nr:phosphotransferase [Micrococcus sp.]
MWQDEARQWLREVLPAAGPLDIEVVRERAWGTIWRVTAGGDLYWFKRAHPELRQEVRLRRVLQHRAPDLVLEVVADHAERGWMVTIDQGPTLASLAREQGPHHYEELAASMAEIQRSVTAADLAGLGLPVFAPRKAVDQLDEMLAPFAELPVDHPAHVSPGEREGALERLAAVVDRWTRLEAAVPGLGLDHNDLHAGNAFPGPRISDWGDAVIAHPFGSLRALLVPARNTFGPEVVDPIRRAYLAGFADGSGDGPGGVEALQEALDVAMMLAVPQRLAAWRAMQDPQSWAEYAHCIGPLWREAGVPAERVTVP